MKSVAKIIFQVVIMGPIYVCMGIISFYIIAFLIGVLNFLVTHVF